MSDFTGRYVFVGGLHRTGTSLVARLIGHHPDVREITGSPAPENEGCYLQGAIAHTARHGRPAHFATDPQQHHIEGSRFDRLDVRIRMESDWGRWFEAGGAWRVEKSPVNLTRMRLYQQLFPLSQFVIVLRHPEAMAAAMAKWTDQPPADLIDHALDAYARMEADLPYLHAAFVLRYEDLVADPDGMTARLHHFLDLPPAAPAEPVIDGNLAYRATARLSPGQALKATHWGYAPGLDVQPFDPWLAHPLRAIRDRAQQI